MIPDYTQPLWWATENTRRFLWEKYFPKEVSLEQRIDEICAYLLKLSGDQVLVDRYRHLVEMGHVTLPSPMWSNFGSPRNNNLSISCNSSLIPDSIAGFAESISELMVLTKGSAGTAMYLGDVRAKGSPISTGGHADGIMPLIEQINHVMGWVTQGNRRGRVALYLPIDHPEIEEFLEIGGESSDIQDVMTAVCVPDWFMERVEAKDRSFEGMKVWAKVIQARKEKGHPYIHFDGNVNRGKPQWYKDKDIDIKASNLCVAGATEVLTDSGYQLIKDLEGQAVKVWNGEQFSTTTVYKTGADQKLLRVTTDTGSNLDCTPYHKWHVKTGYRDEDVTIKRTYELTPGDKLISYSFPVINGEVTLDKAYHNGLLSGCGCPRDEGSTICFTDCDKEECEGLKPKYFVPDALYTVESRLEWLAGLIDGCGDVIATGDSPSLRISGLEVNFAREVVATLSTLGRGEVLSIDDGESYWTPDEDGDYRKQVTLIVKERALAFLMDMGLKPRRLILPSHFSNSTLTHLVGIVSINELDGAHDTYCFNEPLREMGVFNGILTGNCSEIHLPSNEDETFVCNLAALNLVTREYWPYFIYETIVDVMDWVQQDYIESVEDRYGFRRAYNFAKNHRALGLGVCGWHDYLQSKGIAIDSMEAYRLNREVFKEIDEGTLAATRKLAEEVGEAPVTEGYGVRNAARIALMPTTSSAMILGGVSQSIEPKNSNYFVKNLAGGSYTYKNPYLQKVLASYGQDDRATWQSILHKGGSVQHLSVMTDKEKNVFKTAFEVSQLALVKQAAQRQKFIDQGQSLNVFIPPGTPNRDINALLVEGWKSGVKAFYYQRSKNVTQGLVNSIMDCEVCSV